MLVREDYIIAGEDYIIIIVRDHTTNLTPPVRAKNERAAGRQATQMAVRRATKPDRSEFVSTKVRIESLHQHIRAKYWFGIWFTCKT